MVPLRLAGLALVPVLLVFASCGGDDDSKNSDSGSSPSPSSVHRSPTASGTRAPSGNPASTPKIKDGSFNGAKLHIEMSGGKDMKLDLEGSGLGMNGRTLLSFGNTDASAQVTMQFDPESVQSGLVLIAKGIATGGGWGEDCSVQVDDGDKQVKGEFECKQLDGVETGQTKTLKVDLKGTFSATRE